MKEFSITKQQKDLLKSRQDTVKYLKIIVWMMWGTTLFNFIYSVLVMARWTAECTPRSSMTIAWNFYDLFDRLDSYILWFYPLIYLFWPTKKQQQRDKRFVKVIGNLNLTLSLSSSEYSRSTGSNRYYDNHLSVNSSSSSDDEYDYGNMGTG